MSSATSTSEHYERARQRVQAIKGFYINLSAYVLVNIGLFILDLLTPGGPWFFWPLLGWGIGVVAQAFAVFVFAGVGEEWEARKIRELMEREAR